MCQNNVCPLSQTCYRFMAKPTEHWQAYGSFSPNEKGECDSYDPIVKIKAGDKDFLMRKKNYDSITDFRKKREEGAYDFITAPVGDPEK